MIRVDTNLDKDTLKEVNELAEKEMRKPAAMLRVLILEALSYRKPVACKHQFVPDGAALPVGVYAEAICKLCGHKPTL